MSIFDVTVIVALVAVFVVFVRALGRVAHEFFDYQRHELEDQDVPPPCFVDESDQEWAPTKSGGKA